jgi:DNA-directed RNA polymerase specialized sigma24 family protein
MTSSPERLAGTPPMPAATGSPAVGAPEWLVAVYPRLLRSLQGARVSRAWAEDAAQHAVAQALTRPEALRRSPNPFGWLLATGHHYAIDRARERRRWRPLPGLELEDRCDGRAEAIRVVWEGLRHLLEQERVVLEQHYFEGLSDQRVGEILFAQGTAQARGQRARKRRLGAEARLRHLLEKGTSAALLERAGPGARIDDGRGRSGGTGSPLMSTGLAGSSHHLSLL